MGVATGGIALLNVGKEEVADDQIAGFELVGDNYVMQVRNDSLVNGIIQTINKRLVPQSRLVKYSVFSKQVMIQMHLRPQTTPTRPWWEQRVPRARSLFLREWIEPSGLCPFQ